MGNIELEAYDGTKLGVYAPLALQTCEWVRDKIEELGAVSVLNL